MTQFFATLLAAVFPPLCCDVSRADKLISFRTMSYVQASVTVLLCATYNTPKEYCSREPCSFKNLSRPAIS